jgi:cell division protein FtsL
MIAAEQWYQHQENYQKYGLDMKPRTERKKPQPQKRVFTEKDKVRILALILAVAVLCIGMIITSSYAAQIKYQTNSMLTENHMLESEIGNLNVELYAATSIDTVEKKATKKLGMVYPESNQVVYITGEKVPESGFAQTMKKQAYN